MTTEYQERPRKGGGTEFCRNYYATGSDQLNRWQRLLPIAFTAENAQKVHDRTKTQTRRLLNPQPPEGFDRVTVMPLSGETCFSNAAGKNWPVNRTDSFKWLLPRYRVGDVLWVQEPWRTLQCDDYVKPTLLDSISAHVQVHYEGTGKTHDFGKLRPGRFLPLRFARPARYEVTAVRCERVNETSEADAKAEGIERIGKRCWQDAHGMKTTSVRQAFYTLWNSIHTKRGTRFEDAPWVFAYTFRRCV